MVHSRIILFLLVALFSTITVSAQKYGTRTVSQEDKIFNREFSGTWLPKGYWLNSTRVGIFEQEDRFYMLTVVDAFSAESKTAIHELESLKKQNPELEVILVIRPANNISLSREDYKNYIIRNDIKLPVYIAEGEIHKNSLIRYDSLPYSHFLRNDFSMQITHQGTAIWEACKELAEAQLNLWKNFKVTKSGITTSDDGLLTYQRMEGVLNYPVAIAGDERGEKVWIWTAGESQVIELNLNGDVVDIIGNGKKGYKDGSYGSCQFGNSGDMVFDRKNDKLYLADHYSNTIREIDLNKKSVKTILGDGTYNQKSLPEKIKSADKLALKSPHSLELKGDLLYFSMKGDHAIWSYDIIKGEATRLIGNGIAGVVDGKKKKAMLTEPSGLAMNSAGDILFVDGGTNSIRSWDGKKLSTLQDSELGKGSHELMALNDSILVISEYQHSIRSLTSIRGLSKADDKSFPQFKDARLSNAKFAYPAHATEVNGLVFIADAGNQCIRILEPESKMVQTMPLGDDELILEQKMIFDGAGAIRYLEEVKMVEGQNTIALEMVLPNGFSFPENGKSSIYVIDSEFDELIDYSLSDGEILFLSEGDSKNVHLTFEFAMEYVEDTKPQVRLLKTCRGFIPYFPADEGETKSEHKIYFFPLVFAN